MIKTTVYHYHIFLHLPYHIRLKHTQALVPGADALTAGARAAARATSTSFCGDFVKASRLLRHACAPDIAGDPRDESAAG